MAMMTNKSTRQSFARDPARIDQVLAVLRDAWQTKPQLRLGQLIAGLATERPNPELFYMEDEEFARRLAHFHDAMRDKAS